MIVLIFGCKKKMKIAQKCLKPLIKLSLLAFHACKKLLNRVITSTFHDNSYGQNIAFKINKITL